MNLFTNSKYKDSKLEIVQNNYNIYWKDNKDSRDYIFNVDINNKTVGSTRRFIIWLS